ncbi:MAG: uroporphyrinogen-III C-methyltransferase [Deltaproteobacteria bacterium]|nr:uroporphyrinogen-III C-methyltransferase [Deltaproteobacteria bacterium]MCL5276162.1 uroporphyrinogen-III C-methyltransferase [Deltaproteobacteria bacterium]
MSRGKVYIAGAGPGDPELLTLKVINRIKAADVIVYDHLIDRDVLRYARQSVELIYAGKMAGEHLKSQDEINGILIEKALAGHTVLRLKGGDPFLFGRGGEEALALAEEGIDFEIVSGVSSINAVPLYAGIPLTHRGLSSSVVVITGHRHTEGGMDEHNWDAIAKIDTIVVLMGVAQIKQIALKLVDNGREMNDTVGVIRWGTTPVQSSYVCTLKDIIEENHRPFATPALIIIGRVVGLHKKLNWFERLPLFGRRVLVTRAEKDSGPLKQSLEMLGAFVIEQPTIEIVAPDDYAPLDAALDELGSYDTIIFTSANAVKRFMDRLWSSGRDIRSMGTARILAIGPRTAKSIEDLKIRVSQVPEEFRAEGLVDMLEGRVQGERILIPRAAEARTVLIDGLRKMGAEVNVVPVYKTIRAEVNQDMLPYIKDGVDLAVFTSSSTVKNFFEMFGGNAFKILERADIACIGPITAKTVGEMGLEVSIQAPSYTVESLVREIGLFYGNK